jgi:hypothetical protein
MANAVRSRPNHYETLGITPSASEAEIASAFALRMGVSGARPMGTATQVCMAYETLRDPARRRAYDRAMGFAPKPQPQQWSVPVAEPRWSPFIGSAAASRAAPEPSPPPPPQVSDELHRLSSVVASLRELARPMETEAETQAPPQRETPRAAAEPDIRELLGQGRLDDERSDEVRAFDWRRPALAAGGLILAAGLIGTVAGLWVRDGGSEAPEPAVTVNLPSAKARPVAPAPVAADSATDELQVRGAVRTVARRAHGRRAAPPQQLADTAPDAHAPETAFVQTATEQAVAEAPAVPSPAVAADLPLSASVMARTIQRIGYACGGVSSATAVDGAPGTFKVTCSAGETYRAAPVHGRYHFRRWSGG